MNEPRHQIDETLLAIKDFPKFEDFVLHASARVFGQKVKLSAPVQEYYHSDLFHDAKQLEVVLSEFSDATKVEWFWSVDVSGTTWHGPKVDYPESVRECLYRFEVVREARSWGEVLKLYVNRVNLV